MDRSIPVVKTKNPSESQCVTESPVEKFLRQFEENRKNQIANADFSFFPVGDRAEPVTLPESSDLEKEEKSKSYFSSVKAFFGCLLTWFDFSRSNEKGVHRKSVSTLLGFFVFAVSISLIVSGSILVTQGENANAKLKKEITAFESEALEMQSRIDAQNDTVLIRKIATEEFGMIQDSFVRSEYLSVGASDSVESYREESEEAVGITALLSALGINP